MIQDHLTVPRLTQPANLSWVDFWHAISLLAIANTKLHRPVSPVMLLLNALVDQPLFCNLLAECLQPADHSNY